jgi:HrpA-like RNA helicase
VLLGLLARALPLRNALAKEQALALAEKKAKDPLFLPPPPNSPLAPLGPLKLVIMSATLRVADFTENKALFPRRVPPVVNVSSRQFPVTVHFAKKTELTDYVTEAAHKVTRIHKRLPDGGILVFLTGQHEVEELCAQLRKRLRRKKRNAPAPSDAPPPLGGAAEEAMESGGEAAEACEAPSDTKEKEDAPVYILPLFALLPKSEQDKVFLPPPAHHRLIVVATNVAETSITIPGIRCVQAELEIPALLPHVVPALCSSHRVSVELGLVVFTRAALPRAPQSVPRARLTLGRTVKVAS